MSETAYIAFYAPQAFRPIWEKFKKIAKREGLSSSQLLRRIIEDYVRLHDPGNPQRPITAFVEGHLDSYKAQHQQRLQKLMEIAKIRDLRYSDILTLCSELEARRRFMEAESLAKDLSELGVKVWR
jgi:hypothetical protein